MQVIRAWKKALIVRDFNYRSIDVRLQQREGATEFGEDHTHDTLHWAAQKPMSCVPRRPPVGHKLAAAWGGQRKQWWRVPAPNKCSWEPRPTLWAWLRTASRTILLCGQAYRSVKAVWVSMCLLLYALLGSLLLRAYLYVQPAGVCACILLHM